MFCPESFRGIVEAQAHLSGMPSYKPVTIPGMIVAQSPLQITAKVEQVADEIIGGLVQG